jgi:AcrR family transcriptional regulator
MTNFNDKQLQIIETAEKLFAAKGFDGTSVRDIADAADINVAMISYYFGSKEKLMEAIFEIKIGKVQMRVEELLKDTTMTPIEKVNILVDEHIEKVIKSQQFYRIMICEQVSNKSPAIMQKVKTLKVRNAELIAELIKEGQKKGDFKKKVDVVLMLNTMIGTVWQTIITKDHYQEFTNNQALSDEEYEKLLKKKLMLHIKTLFKVILTNEE